MPPQAGMKYSQLSQLPLIKIISQSWSNSVKGTAAGTDKCDRELAGFESYKWKERKGQTMKWYYEIHVQIHNAWVKSYQLKIINQIGHSCVRIVADNSWHLIIINHTGHYCVWIMCVHYIRWYNDGSHCEKYFWMNVYQEIKNVILNWA